MAHVSDQNKPTGSAPVTDERVSFEMPAAVESKVASGVFRTPASGDRSDSLAVPSEFTVRLGVGPGGSAPYTPLTTPLTSLQDLNTAPKPEFEVVDSKGVTHAIDKDEMQRIYHKTLEHEELDDLQLDDSRPHYAPTMKYRPYILKQMRSIRDDTVGGEETLTVMDESLIDASSHSSKGGGVSSTTTVIDGIVTTSSSTKQDSGTIATGDSSSTITTSRVTHHHSIGDSAITEVSPAPSSSVTAGAEEREESPHGSTSVDTGTTVSTVLASVGASPTTATTTDEIKTPVLRPHGSEPVSSSSPSRRRVSRRLSDIVMGDPHWSKQYTFLSTFDKWRHISLQIMRNHNCFDVLPLSSKVVVFDTLLPVKHALRALAEHDTKSAPVWDSRRHCFVGLLTVTDFTLILSKCVDSRRGSTTDEEDSVSFDGTAGRGKHLSFPMSATLDSMGTLKVKSSSKSGSRSGSSALSLDEGGIRRAVRQMEELNVGQWLKLKRRSDRYTNRRRARMMASISKSTVSMDPSDMADSRSTISGVDSMSVGLMGSSSVLSPSSSTRTTAPSGGMTVSSMSLSSGVRPSGKRMRNNVIGVLYDEPLISAVCTINTEHIHRLPVFKDEERKSLLSILNYSQILRFLILRLEEDHRTSITVTLNQLDFPCLNTEAMRQARLSGRVSDLKNLSEIKEGIKQNRIFGSGLASVPILYMDDPLLTGISLLADNWRWQACVILDPDDFTVKGAFLRSDIRFFSMNRAYLNLGQTVGRFLEEHRNERRVVKVRCSKQLFHAMYNMLALRQHCSVVVSEYNELIAVLGLRDIFERLIHV